MGKLIVWTIVHTLLLPVDAHGEFEDEYPSSTAAPSEVRNKPLNKSAIINRTRLYSCDQTIKLYSLSPSIKNKTVNRVESCERYGY